MIVCVSRQDWDAGLPTNRQQIMRRAAERGHEVLFVESGGHIGRHLWRLAVGPGRGSLLRRLDGGDRPAERITVRKALTVAPWGQKFAFANRINSWLTSRRLRRAGGDAARVLWLYDPTAFELVGHANEALAVYDCVDDYAEQVGDDPRRRRFVALADAESAARAQVVFATTSGLYERQSRQNAQTHLVRNGADFRHFSDVASEDVVPEIRALPEPVLGFSGNLTSGKVDFDLLEKVASRRPDWNFVFVGPVASDALAAMNRLTTLPNVHALGFRRYEELPTYVAGFSVGLIPYAVNDYTRNCSPLKVFEYLAAGKPVVASGVTELVGMEPDVVVAGSVEEFVAAVERALADRDAGATERRRELARENTWDGRTARLLQIVDERLGSAT